MTIRTDRPRLFFTPETLAAKKAEAAANVPRWKSLKAVTQAAFTETSKDWIPNLALCYAITGDAKYARRAYTLLKLVTDKGMASFIADSGKPAAELMLYAALVYDWCNDALTDQERIGLESQMTDWNSWIWAPREKAWGVDAPADNYFAGFIEATWLYGLATSDEVSATLARDKFLKRLLPFLQTEEKGGFLVEGSNYGAGSLASILRFLAAHKTATGENLIGMTEWVEEAWWCQFHMTAPNMIGKAPLGDQASSYNSKHSDTDRAIGLLLATYAGMKEQVKPWLDNIKPSICTRGADFWFEWLWYPQ